MPEERITAVIPIKKYAEDRYVFMATKKGLVKKTIFKEFANIRKSGLIAINLREDDELIEVKITDGNKDIFLVTKDGMCIRFKEQDVRATGRSSMGVNGMSLSDNDEIIGMQLDTQGDYLLFVSANGMGKRTEIDEFNIQYRGGKGVKCYKITEKTGQVVGVKAVHDDNEVMLITTEGIVIRILANDISVLGRITSGVKLINLDDKNVFVASMAKVREDSKTTSDEEVIKNLEKELQEDTASSDDESEYDDYEEYDYDEEDAEEDEDEEAVEEEDPED